MSTAFEIAVNLFQGFMMIGFMRAKLKAQKSRPLWLDAAFVLLIAGWLTLYLFLPVPVPDTVIIIVPFLYAVATGRGSWLGRVLWTAVLYGVMAGISWLSIGIYQNLFHIDIARLAEPSALRVGFCVITNTAMAVTLHFIVKIRKHESANDTAAYITVLLIVLEVTATDMFYIYSTDPLHGEVYLIIAITGGIGCAVLTFLLYEIMSRSAEKRHMEQMMDETAVLSRKYQQDMEALYQRILTAQHDLRHQMGTIAQLPPSEDTPILTGCIGTDAVLTAKKAAAEKQGIRFDFVPFPVTPLPMEETELCILLSNLLDNAIEGARKAEQPRCISLRFDRVYSMFYIHCQNTADAAAIHRSGDHFLSDKRDGLPHGLGIESVRRTVTNRGGRCEFSVKDDLFRVFISIPGEYESITGMAN